MPLVVATLQAALTAGLPAGLAGASRSTQATLIATAYDAYAKLGVSCAMIPPSKVNFSDLKKGLVDTMEKDNSPLEAAQGWAAAFEKYWTGAMFGGTGMVTVIGGTKALEAQLTVTFANPMNTLPIFITQVSIALDTFTKTVIVAETALPPPPAGPCGAAPII